MNIAFEPAPTRAVSGSSHPLLSGWVDLDRLSRAEDIHATREQETTVLATNGLAIRLDGAADWHAAGGVLAVVIGHPVLGDRPARAVDLVGTVHSGGSFEGLGGRFALVLVDTPGRIVKLRTDRFGVWPLCWAREAGTLAFSDRADSVPLGQPRTLDPQALFDYVYFHMIPAPRTVFHGVARLEPASELLFTPAGARIQPVWQARFSTRRRGHTEDLAERFRSAIRQSVTEEADDSEVGCFLSGGTDSSTVAGMLKAVTGKAASFSIGFDAKGYDEMEYARIAACHFGTDHHEHYVTPAELVAAIPRVAAHYDQPFGNSSAVPAFICARLAREHGVHKLLAGDGGDELFGGNSRYAKQKVFEAWWQLPPPARAALSPVLANGLTRRLPLARKAASYVDQASVPMPARLETYNLLRRFGHANVFNPEFLRHVDVSEPERLQSEIYSRNARAPFVDRMLAYDWRFTLADNDLPKVCGTTRLAGVGVGFPLLADALVDLSTDLEPGDKVRGLRLRHFFKKSLTGFLPPEIIAKKKHGFGLPVGVWLVRDAPFRGLAQECLSSLAARRLVTPRLVDDLFSRRLEEHAGYYGEMIWVLLMLEQWIRSHDAKWTA